MITIIKSSDVEFQPHLALCHMTLNGGSANEENTPLVMKSKQEGDGITKVLKELGEDVSIIEKASYRNVQRMLESSIREAFKPEEDEEYVYIWLQDFDETTAVFEYGSKCYAVSYTVNEAGIVLLGTDFKEVVRQDVYVSTSGDSLILKGSEEVQEENPAVNTEEITDEGDKSSDSSQKEEEKTMTDKVELSVEELEAQIQKAAEDAIVKAKAEWEAEAKHAEVMKSTTEIVKGLSFVAQEDAEAVVKALVSLDGEMLHIVKALQSAAEKITEVEAEKEQIKKEFGEQTTIEAKPEEDKQDLASILKANVAAAKAKNK